MAQTNHRDARPSSSKLITRRQSILNAGAVFAGVTFGPIAGITFPDNAASEEVSHTAESIHQEISFKADRKRVYGALTQSQQFAKVTQLSAAVKSGMAANTEATRISQDPGGSFSLFGGIISGRHIELIPYERIVQAWRTSDWEAGVYSIAKFALVEEGANTRLIFDHTGFPVGQADHLAAGWKANYWEPLAQFLA